MHHVGMIVIRVTFSQDAGQAKQSVSQEVSLEWRSPAAISPVQAPREVGEDSETVAAKLDLLDTKQRLRPWVETLCGLYRTLADRSQPDADRLPE